MSHGRYIILLVVAFAILWGVLAVNPSHRSDWLLENVLLVGAVVALALSYRSFPLSRVSYTLLFVFLCLHTIGAHYTYSEVPYDRWFVNVFGTSLDGLLGWERNNFDRVVHFSYGLLLAYPIREVFLRVADVKGFWGYFLPLDVTMSTSMIYELVEWYAAVEFGGELGAAFLGSQGDVWDAHKDMALASLGAALAMGLTAIINAFLHRDFGREWAESLRIKSASPLGEVAIAAMVKERRETAGG